MTGPYEPIPIKLRRRTPEERDQYNALKIVKLQSDLAAAQRRVTELEATIAEFDDPSNRVVPYWMWHGLLSIVINHDCEIDDDGCENTGDCITEWCIPCAARAFWSELHKSKPAPTPGEGGGE